MFDFATGIYIFACMMHKTGSSACNGSADFARFVVSRYSVRNNSCPGDVALGLMSDVQNST
jgi:hypothetical protein